MFLGPPVERAALGLLGATAAAGALAAQPDPTATTVGSIAVTACVAVVVVAAAAFARPPALLAAALLAAVGAAASWVGVAAAAVALSAYVVRHRPLGAQRVLGAIIGVALVQVLSRMPTGRLGLNLAVSSLAVGVLLVSAAPALGAPTRARLRRLLLVLGGAAAAACVGLAISIVLSRQAIQRGIDRADEGLEAAREGDGEQAATLLDDAGRAFASAHRDLGAWWTKPALVLPGVGQQVRALEVLTEEGADLATAAATAARSARIEDLRVTDGRLDLDHVRSMAAPLASIRASLARADRGVARAESPWLVGPVAHRLTSFQRSIEAATEDAATASEAIAVLPDLLGGSGDRRYFVAFGTPSEARDLGGFMGAYAILQAVDGELSLRSTGRVRNLNLYFQGGRLTDPEAFPDHYRALLPQRFWQNVTGSADFPTVAEAVHQLWTPLAGPLDGVLYLDPHALATMLELTGPIRLDGYPTPLTSRTAADFLLRDQYIEFPNDDRHDFLVDAATSVFSTLTSGELPGPRELADTMAPAVHGRRLLFNSFHPDEQALFERLHLDGALPPVSGDFLSVRASNRGRSKIDAFMQRSVAYDVSADPRTGTVHATVTVNVRNDAPATGLPYPVIGNHLDRPQGTNSTTISVYTPLELVDVQMDGESIGRGAYEEYDRNRFSALVDILPGRDQTVTFELEGPMDLSDGYHLDVVPQPLVNNDRFDINIQGPPGWTWSGRSRLTRVLREDATLDVSFFPFGGG